MSKPLLFLALVASVRAECPNACSGNGICSWCMMALVTLVSQTKDHQLAVLRNGGVTWLAKALGHFVSDTYDELRQEDGTFPASLRPYPSLSESQSPGHGQGTGRPRAQHR